MALDMRFGRRWRHARLRSLVDAYLDGELPAGRVADMESHLARCGPCAGAVSVGRELKAALGGLSPVAAPRSFALTPLMAGQAHPAPVRRSAAMLRVAQMTAGGAIVALAAVVATDLWGGTSSSDEGAMMATGAVDSARNGAGAGAPAAQGQEQTVGGSASARDASSAPTLPTLAGPGAGTQANAAPPQAPEEAANKSAAPGSLYSSAAGDAFAGPVTTPASPIVPSEREGAAWMRVSATALLGLLLIAVAAWIFLAKSSRRE